VAVSVATLQRRVLYRLRISDAGGALELLRYTFATEDVPAALTSAADLPGELLGHLKARFERFATKVDAALLADQVELLGALVQVRDAAGLLTVQSAPGDGYHALELGILDAGTVYFVFVSIPHSLESPLC